MITVHLSGPPKTSMDDKKSCVIALGYFDGVHLGHRKVIATAKEMARRSRTEFAVMTFSPHPKEIIGKGKEQVHHLMPFLQKEKIMAELGVDKLYVVEFNEALASLPPETFVSEYLIGLSTAHVVVGFDFNYGSKGKGNTDTLEADGKGAYLMTVVPQVDYNGQKISSTLIRNLLKVGDVQQVSALLGDFYETRGGVSIECGVLKHHRIQAGFHPLPQYMLPTSGSYEIRLEWDHKRMHGTAWVESGKGNKTSVYLEMLAPTNEQWSKELLNIKWVKRLSSGEDHHGYTFVDVEMPIQMRS